MASKRFEKKIGYINEDIIEKYNLYEYAKKPIVRSLDLYAHIEKHKNDFKSKESYDFSIENIDNIILNPDFVYYEKDRKSLMYFKKLYENVCVVVKLKLRENKNSYVASMYPISEQKLQKIIEKSYMKVN